MLMRSRDLLVVSLELSHCSARRLEVRQSHSLVAAAVDQKTEVVDPVEMPALQQRQAEHRAGLLAVVPAVAVPEACPALDDETRSIDSADHIAP